MSKRETRILIGIALIVALVIVGGVIVASLQSSATTAGFSQQQAIETRNAGIEQTASAQP